MSNWKKYREGNDENCEHSNAKSELVGNPKGRILYCWVCPDCQESFTSASGEE